MKKSILPSTAEFISSRRELVANSVHTADATRRLNHIGISGMYWAK